MISWTDLCHGAQGPTHALHPQQPRRANPHPWIQVWVQGYPRIIGLISGSLKEPTGIDRKWTVGLGLRPLTAVVPQPTPRKIAEAGIAPLPRVAITRGRGGIDPLIGRITITGIETITRIQLAPRIWWRERQLKRPRIGPMVTHRIQPAPHIWRRE